jgi:hypothetical protein
VKKLIALAALAAALGCNQSSPTTAPPTRENETDIKVRTPGAKVDVQGKGVNVDVERKKNNP